MYLTSPYLFKTKITHTLWLKEHILLCFYRVFAGLAFTASPSIHAFVLCSQHNLHLHKCRALCGQCMSWQVLAAVAHTFPLFQFCTFPLFRFAMLCGTFWCFCCGFSLSLALGFSLLLISRSFSQTAAADTFANIDYAQHRLKQRPRPLALPPTRSCLAKVSLWHRHELTANVYPYTLRLGLCKQSFG